LRPTWEQADLVEADLKRDRRGDGDYCGKSDRRGQELD
jgi:hypothetical protein